MNYLEGIMCDRRRITAYLQNKLDLDSKLEVLDHVEHCPHCWYQLYLLRKLPQAFYGYCGPAIPAA